MLLQSWGDVVVASLQTVWASVAAFVPRFFVALVVFVIGWIVAVSVGKMIELVVKSVRADHVLAKVGFGEVLERAGWRLNSGAFIGGLVRWFLIIAFLIASVDILGLTQVTDFLRDVILYIPNVVVAALILIIGAIVASTLEHVVRGSVEAAGYKGALVGTVTRWSIWVFAVLAAVLQLKIAEDIVRTLITGIVYGVSLALALAFGLGGKDVAASFLEKVRGELRR